MRWSACLDLVVALFFVLVMHFCWPLLVSESETQKPGGDREAGAAFGSAEPCLLPPWSAVSLTLVSTLTVASVGFWYLEPYLVG